MATEVADARLTQTESADANVFIDTNTTDLTTILGEFTTYLKSGGSLGTPSSGVATNLTGTAGGLTAGNVTTNANLTGHVTSVGNAAVLGSFTIAQLDAAVSDAAISTATGVEDNADVTDAVNVTLAGALMDSECVSLGSVKALDQGVAVADTPQFAGIELGHATQNTLTASGGTLSVEGVEVYTKSTLKHAPIDLLGNVMLTVDGEAFFEPYSILATNDLFAHPVLRLGSDNTSAPSTKHGAYGAIAVPDDYSSSGTLKVVIQWTSTLTTGNVVFDFDYRSVGGNDTESLDQASYQESLTVTDAAPSASHERMTAELTLTGSNVAAGDTLTYFINRDGTDASDTLAGSALIHSAILQYTA